MEDEDEFIEDMDDMEDDMEDVGDAMEGTKGKKGSKYGVWEIDSNVVDLRLARISNWSTRMRRKKVQNLKKISVLLCAFYASCLDCLFCSKCYFHLNCTG